MNSSSIAVTRYHTPTLDSLEKSREGRRCLIVVTGFMRYGPLAVSDKLPEAVDHTASTSKQRSSVPRVSVLGQVVESHLRLSEKTKTELEKSTRLLIGISDEKGDHITPEGAHLTYRFAVKEAAGTKGPLVQHVNAIFEEDKDGIVQYGMDGVRWTMGKGPDLCDQLERVIRDLSDSPEVERLRNSRVKMEEAAQQSKEIIGLIRAGWYVPGKCRVCERMKQ